MNDNRKNYRKLLELVAKGEVSKVIVTYPDRLMMDRLLRFPRITLIGVPWNCILHMCGLIYSISS